MLAWVQGDDVGGVRTRALAGGPIRSQTVGRDLGVTGLDHDGHRLVVTGVTTPRGGGQEDFDLRLVTLGSRRVRVLRTVSRGEDYRAMQTPVLTGDGAVDVADVDNEDTAAVLTRVPLNRPGRRTVRYFGMGFTTFARGGGRLVYVEAPSYFGCGSAFEPEDDEAIIVSGGCRIVRAGGDPFGGERTLPAELLSGKAVAEPGGGFRVGGQLRQRVFREGRTTGRRPLAGRSVTVLLAESRNPKDGFDLSYPSSGPQVVTDAEGRWSFSLPPSREERYVGAATVDAPRTWVDQVIVVPPTPAGP